MNRKAQVGQQVGMIIILSVVAIVGVVLFQAISQEVGKSTNTGIVNASIGTATNGTAIYLTDYKSISNVVIRNATSGGAIVGSGNYTITNNVIDPTTGGLAVKIIPQASGGYYGNTWYIYGITQPTTYIDNSGARGMAALIGIFFALGIAIVMLTPTIRNGLLEMIDR